MKIAAKMPYCCQIMHIIMQLVLSKAIFFSEHTLPLVGKDFSNYLQGGKEKEHMAQCRPPKLDDQMC